MIFCRVFQTRNVDKIWTFKTVTIGDEPRSIGAIARIKMRMVNAIVDDVNGIEWHLEKAANVARSGSADGDDFVLSSDQAADASAGIEHPAPIVFVRDVKRGKVVNSRNQPAGVLPDHPPITWDVQDVQFESASQRW